MSDYAQAINRALEERSAQLHDYGGFPAQAGFDVTELKNLSFEDWQHAHRGYIQQLVDYPNG